MVGLAAAITLTLLSTGAEAARDPAECEVCIKVLNDVAAKLKPEDKRDIVRIEEKIAAHCAKPGNEKEGRLVSVGRCAASPPLPPPSQLADPCSGTYATCGLPRPRPATRSPATAAA